MLIILKGAEERGIDHTSIRVETSSFSPPSLADHRKKPVNKPRVAYNQDRKAWVKRRKELDEEEEEEEKVAAKKTRKGKEEKGLAEGGKGKGKGKEEKVVRV